jgi:DNA-binding SARP family transcriptional activator
MMHVQLFGRLKISGPGEVLLLWHSRKVQELFAYLLLSPGKSHPREILADLLWPDALPHLSRKYLRQTLWQLKRALDATLPRDSPILLETDGEQVHLQVAPLITVDVHQFEATTHAVDGIDSTALTAEHLARMEQAIPLYRDDLLMGWYQEWCLLERERLRMRYIDLLQQLMRVHQHRRSYHRACTYGEMVLRYDPAHEPAYRQLMVLYALQGNRSAALRLYHRCAKALARELDVEPSPATTHLYQHLREDALMEAITRFDGTAIRRILASHWHTLEFEGSF